MVFITCHSCVNIECIMLTASLLVQKVITLKLPAYEVEALDAMAHQNRRTRTSMLRMLIVQATKVQEPIMAAPLPTYAPPPPTRPFPSPRPVPPPMRYPPPPVPPQPEPPRPSGLAPLPEPLRHLMCDACRAENHGSCAVTWCVCVECEFKRQTRS